MNKIYVTKRHIQDLGFSELDFKLYTEFGFDYDEHEDFEVIQNEDEYGRADGFPVKIDDIIEKLNEMKSNGSTHVELDYNCDHIGYEISGFEIRLSTDEEIDIVVKEEEEKAIKQEKLQGLYNQINELRDEV